MAANNNAISPSQNIPRFAGINYQFWRVKMKTLFVSCDLWELVENGFVDLADSEEVPRLTVAQRNELKEKKKKDAKALFMIQQALDEAIFPRVIGATTSKEAWDLLQDEYQGSSRMKAFDTIQDFFTKVSSLVNEIRSLGEDLIEQKIVEKVLRSLPPGFDHVVAAIEESKDLPEYSLIELMGSLQAHEQRLNRSADTSMEHAFQTKVNQKKKGLKTQEEEVMAEVLDMEIQHVEGVMADLMASKNTSMEVMKENNGREMPIIIVDESSNLETISPHESPSTTTDTLSSSSIDSTPRRVRNLADIYASCEFACFAMEPTCFEDAVDKEEWVIAMKKELAATEKNNTWSLVDLPIGKEAIDLKWIYRSKFNPDRTLQKNKA
uniref:Uncharacterized protein LOC105060979 n=1 Tax=Elaeis guineensis var. tenera TaxID=51953 RepID=A0A6I9SP70_ELAGV|nr:uncharacterized protein LOC105060979 [Elaeis guineensis]